MKDQLGQKSLHISSFRQNCLISYGNNFVYFWGTIIFGKFCEVGKEEMRLKFEINKCD